VALGLVLSDLGGHPIRSSAAIAIVLAAAPLLFAASPEPVVILVDKDRREVLPVVRGEAELIPLPQLLIGLPVVAAPDPKGGQVTLSVMGREVTLYDRKSLFSVQGDLRLLSSAVVNDGGRWLVPIDSVPRILGPLLGRRAEWRAAQRVLLIGDVPVPRVTVATSVSGDTVRVVLEASQKVPFRVDQQPGRIQVAMPRDVVEVVHQPERLTGGIVDLVQFVGGRENVLAVTLGRRFKELKSSEQDSPPRLVLEFQATPVAAAVEPSTDPGLPSPAPPVVGAPGIRTVVIDPGHGGGEVGAMGPGGTLEKDVTLAIARKLRSGLVNNLGLQAFLTRDRDQDLPLDERAAYANNYKADLFISIHANASRASGAHGSEVYFLSYQATDDESRRVAAIEGEAVAGRGPGTGELALILWDMAQAEHLEESSALASRLQEELAEVTGSQGRGVKQAPFRVLVGAAMPAVLVEVAFISNSEEEKLLVSEAYQAKIASALARGIGRYQREHAERMGGTQPRHSGPQS
jgi:N-acetylmuramoyl-L-alanine amidase